MGEDALFKSIEFSQISNHTPKAVEGYVLDIVCMVSENCFGPD